MRASRCLILTLLAICLSGGCTSEPEDVPLTAVHGMVTYQDRPLRVGTVIFVPDETRGHTGPLARAEIGQDGSYRLLTGERPGAAPGKYRITVRATLERRVGQAVLLIPEKYSDPEHSGLSCEVKKVEDNVVNLRLW